VGPQQHSGGRDSIVNEVATFNSPRHSLGNTELATNSSESFSLTRASLIWNADDSVGIVIYEGRMS
jgi:hypothetical protein